MKKIDLIKTVATKANMPAKQSKEIIHTFLTEIQKALGKGEKVVLSGFGTFKSVLVKDKIVVNPKTKQRQTIRSHRAARFTPGRGLKKVIK